MLVTAKFKVDHVKSIETEYTNYPPQKTVVLRAVTTSDGKGNESWSKYTPSGSIEMTITNEAALEVLKPGKTFLLTFEESK
jgi:hypothetical protein